jgi:hypothetical protein
LSTVARPRFNRKVRSDGNVRAQRKTLGIPAECSALPAVLKLVSPVECGILEFMGGASTVLSSVKEGDHWRVQIAWPSGTTHYFGKFGSEREALGWINRHRWLTERDIEGAKIRRPWGSVSQRKSVVDVAAEQTEGGEPASEN